MDRMMLIKSQWDRTTAVAAAVAGVVVLVLGWLGVSGTAYPAEQLPYIISGGIGGLFLLGVSSMLWLSADLHDEWRKLDRIEQAIRTSGWDGAEVDVAAPDERPSAEERASERTERIPSVATEGAR